MSIYQDDMHQDATLFEKTGRDEFGKQGFGSGINIKCRWQDKNEAFTDDKAVQFVSRAIIYCNRDVAIGDKLALGKSATESKAYKILQVLRSPDLDGQEMLIKAIV